MTDDDHTAGSITERTASSLRERGGLTFERQAGVAVPQAVTESIIVPFLQQVD